MEITTKNPADLIGYVNNAKIHSDDQIKLIASSIKEFGFCNPILTDGENGVIAGHGRLAAALRLGLEEVPTIELTGLSKAQKRAYILADNRIGELGVEWDMELVNLELEDLELEDFDIGELDFSLDDDGLGWEADESKISDDFHLDGIEAQITIICNQEEKDKIQQLCSKAIIEEGITDFEFKT